MVVPPTGWSRQSRIAILDGCARHAGWRKIPNTYARHMADYDAIVIGSGPNGLVAAIRIAETGRRVLVLEAAAQPGGGVRSAALTQPGFVHDVCSAIHPFARVSPAFRSMPLGRFGLEWVEPPVMLAHPFDDGSAAQIVRGVDETTGDLGVDGEPYRRLIGTTVKRWPLLETAVLGPLRWPRHPFALAGFGIHALRSAEALCRGRFRTPHARGLIAGIAAHAMLPLDRLPTGAVAIVLGAMAHVAGWSFPSGGAQRLTDSLAGYLRTLGGEIVIGSPVRSIDDLPAAHALLFDLSPRPFLQIAGHRLPGSYRRRLERFRYGMGIFKVDWALDGPIPWINERCSRSATVHLGGTIEAIATSERTVWSGRLTEAPFVILTQPSLFDPSRAPSGCHTAWAYCHVPHRSDADMLARIEQQVERFAPGFRRRVLATSVMRPADIERHNANYVGGDIAAGIVDLGQLFARPTWQTYSTPLRGVYLCSSSTPPGVGVHGMCGYFAAKRALREVLRD